MMKEFSSSPESHLLDAVRQTQTALADALNAGDWERIETLDDELRANLLAASEAVTSESGRRELRQLLESLQGLYTTLMEQGASRRTDLANQLQQVRKNSSAANQYLKSGYGSQR